MKFSLAFWADSPRLLRALIFVATPLACGWVRRQETKILRRGTPLSDKQAAIARKLGVRNPERVRLLSVPQVPPTASWVTWVGGKLGLISPYTIGMTLRYGIFIREDHWGDRRLVTHELAHVAQYERLGGLGPFLRAYLEECVLPGYPLGELEQEAKRAERLA